MWQIITALILLSVCVFFQYHDKLRETVWFYWVTIGYSVLASTLWVNYIKQFNDKKEVFRYSFYWDVAMYLPIVIIPLVMFSIKPGLLASIGLTMIILGSILFHWGSK